LNLKDGNSSGHTRGATRVIDRNLSFKEFDDIRREMKRIFSDQLKDLETKILKN
jgi:hypothetical protein